MRQAGVALKVVESLRELASVDSMLRETPSFQSLSGCKQQRFVCLFV